MEQESAFDEAEYNARVFNCPKCPTAKRLIAPENNPAKKLFCDECYACRPRFANINLGNVVDKYQDTKTGLTRRITEGKKWEIEHRTISPEGVVINSKTGKEAQY